MNSVSGIPNIFGQTKNYNSTKSKAKPVGVAPSGGLEFKSDNLLIKLDPNPSNDLSLSNLGLLCNISNTPLNMGVHKITSTYIPVNDHDLVNKKYLDEVTVEKMNQDDYKIVMNNFDVVKRGIAKNKTDIEQFIHDRPTNDSCWTVNGNTVDQNAKLGTLNNSNVELIRNNEYCLILNDIEVLLNKMLNMNNFKICNLSDPINSKDAVTKNYVDNRKVKNNAGFIPPLSLNSNKQGFVAKSNSEFNENKAGAAFSIGSKGWMTAGILVKAYLQIELPFPVAIWKFALRGTTKGSARWFDWQFEASNDEQTYTILKSASGDYLDTTTKFYFLAPPYSTKYLYYRFYGVLGEPTNPGLSHFQIYTVDDIVY